MNHHTPIALENARSLEQSLEVVVYYLVVLIMFLSYLPLGLTVDHMVINIASIMAISIAVVAYRLMPVQKETGRLRYTFELKSFILITLFMILIGCVVGATGGATSPFILLYAFLIMAAALLLHVIHLAVLIPINLISLTAAEYAGTSGTILEPHLIAVIALILMMYWLAVIIIKRRARHE